MIPESPDGVPVEVSRRALLRDLAVQGAVLASLAAAVAAGVHLDSPHGSAPDPLTARQWQDLAALQSLILPSEPNAPGAVEIGAAAYARLAVRDPRFDPDDLAALRELLRAVDAAAWRGHAKPFAALDAAEQAKLTRELLQDADAADQFGVAVVLTLEALLSDPVYGGNRDGAGWRWLGIAPVQPQPPKPWFQGAV